MSMYRGDLVKTLNELLQPWNLKDYCPNGLQIQGKEYIEKVITGVTASKALIERAIDEKADALLVHHGYFWKGESPVITGMKQARIKALLDHNINLIAYHLPLDVHPLVGNNVQLGEVMQLTNLQPMAAIKPDGILYTGSTPTTSPEQYQQKLSEQLKRDILLESADKPISTVAWCTGGGQSYLSVAAESGIDAFITGEVSEKTIHEARELGISFFSAGHHATERYGVKKLGEWLSSNYKLHVTFIDIPNPA